MLHYVLALRIKGDIHEQHHIRLGKVGPGIVEFVYTFDRTRRTVRAEFYLDDFSKPFHVYSSGRVPKDSYDPPKESVRDVAESIDPPEESVMAAIRDSYLRVVRYDPSRSSSDEEVEEVEEVEEDEEVKAVLDSSSWEGKSHILKSLYEAHRLQLRAGAVPAITSSLYTNFKTCQVEFEVDPLYNQLPPYDPPEYKGITPEMEGGFLSQLRRGWGSWLRFCYWSGADQTAVLEYTKTLTGQDVTGHNSDAQKPPSFLIDLQPMEMGYLGFCFKLLVKHWYRQYAYQDKMKINALAPLPADVCHYLFTFADDQPTATRAYEKCPERTPYETQKLLSDYALYIFRDRLVRDSLPADIKDSSQLELIRTTPGFDDEPLQNYRYYIPPALAPAALFHQSQRRRGGVCSSTGPRVPWDLRMKALRTATHPDKDGPLDLQQHNPGIFVESAAFRDSMVKALFLAYEYRYCPLQYGEHDWKTFVRYYDRFWIAELMVREHEYCDRITPNSSRRRPRSSGPSPTRTDRKARYG